MIDNNVLDLPLRHLDAYGRRHLELPGIHDRAPKRASILRKNQETTVVHSDRSVMVRISIKIHLHDQVDHYNGTDCKTLRCKELRGRGRWSLTGLMLLSRRSSLFGEYCDPKVESKDPCCTHSQLAFEMIVFQMAQFE